MKNFGRGYIFYNQDISDDEVWEDTLKRENFNITQIGREVESGKFEVTSFSILNSILVSKNEILTTKEIQKLIN
jgi:hypothetical protein